VDNASSDETVGWVKTRYLDVRVIENAENVGFGRAHNQAMASVGEGDYYLALNPDAELEPDYIARLVESLERSDPAFGFAVGKLRLKTADGARTMTLYSAGHALTRSGYAFNIGYGLDDSREFSNSGALQREADTGIATPPAAGYFRCEFGGCDNAATG
jgi:GT2 family glycosyltransferase